jgi:hypothetical protein
MGMQGLASMVSLVKSLLDSLSIRISPGTVNNT